MIKNVLRTGAALTLTALTVSLSVTPAQAASRDGRCDAGEFCLYFNSGQQGSVSDFTDSVSDYGSNEATCYVFQGAGAGREECVKNQAASVWNKTTKPVTVFFNSGYGGASQTVAAGVKVNLVAGLKNQNASHRIGAAATYGTPRVNPYPAENTTAPKATRRTQFVADEIARLTGEKDCWVGGYRAGSPTDHNTGNALDCMISAKFQTYPSKAEAAQGTKLAQWLKQNATRLRVSYVIWNNTIWSVRRSSEGWRPYGKGKDEITAGHYDHVHVSMITPG